MNERIKELANKAVGKRSCYMIEAEYIKFAELIVKECALMCEREGHRLSMDNTTENHRDLAKQCHKIGIILTDHFGVEE